MSHIRVVRHNSIQFAPGAMEIMCQMVTYWRLKTMKKFKLSAQNMVAVAYKRWLPMKGSNYSNVTEKILVFFKSGHRQEVVTYEGWSHREV